VGRRVLPAVLVVAAALADGRGNHALAFDALLAAIPFAAVAALVGFGAYLEDRRRSIAGVQALLWALALVLLVTSCAARSPASHTDTLPPLGASALAACLGVLALKVLVSVLPYARLALRPAKP
jgi:hypothetical protein